MDLQNIPLFQISPLIRWLFVVVCYYLMYTTFYVSVADIYRDKKASEGYEYRNHYYVYAIPWRKSRFYGFLLWKCDTYEFAPQMYYGLKFFEFRQLQYTLLCRALAFLFLFGDTVLLMWKSNSIGVFLQYGLCYVRG